MVGQKPYTRRTRSSLPHSATLGGSSGAVAAEIAPRTWLQQFSIEPCGQEPEFPSAGNPSYYRFLQHNPSALQEKKKPQILKCAMEWKKSQLTEMLCFKEINTLDRIINYNREIIAKYNTCI